MAPLSALPWTWDRYGDDAGNTMRWPWRRRITSDNQTLLHSRPKNDPWSWSTPPERVEPCGCYKLRDAAWFGCTEHDRPGGWESWDAYREGWKNTVCVVCQSAGFLGGILPFESVRFNSNTMKMSYAHEELCASQARYVA